MKFQRRARILLGTRLGTMLHSYKKNLGGLLFSKGRQKGGGSEGEGRGGKGSGKGRRGNWSACNMCDENFKK